MLHVFDRCCRHLNHAVARLTVLQVLEVITLEGEALQIGGLRGLLKTPRPDSSEVYEAGRSRGQRSLSPRKKPGNACARQKGNDNSLAQVTRIPNFKADR